jgi:hypothetical protein
MEQLGRNGKFVWGQTHTDDESVTEALRFTTPQKQITSTIESYFYSLYNVNETNYPTRLFYTSNEAILFISFIKYSGYAF